MRRYPTVVKVKVEDRWLVQEVVAGRGYQSHFGSRLTFGCGNALDIDSISIQWHGGKVQEFKGVETDQHLLIVEGESQSTVLP